MPDVHTRYNNLSIETIEDGARNILRCDVRHSEGDRTESVELVVIAPASPTQTVTEAQQAALRRGIAILQSALSQDPIPD